MHHVRAIVKDEIENRNLTLSSKLTVNICYIKPIGTERGRYYNLSDEDLNKLFSTLVMLLEKLGAKKGNEGLCSISAVVYRRKYS